MLALMKQEELEPIKAWWKSLKGGTWKGLTVDEKSYVVREYRLFHVTADAILSQYGLTDPVTCEVKVPHVKVRYYAVRPANKSLELCRMHGADHAAYHWSMQVDPRWSKEQMTAYLCGYHGLVNAWTQENLK